MSFAEFWASFKFKVGRWDHEEARRMCQEVWKEAQRQVPRQYSQSEIESWNALGGSFSEEERNNTGLK